MKEAVAIEQIDNDVAPPLKMAELLTTIIDAAELVFANKGQPIYANIWWSRRKASFRWNQQQTLNDCFGDIARKTTM